MANVLKVVATLAAKQEASDEVRKLLLSAANQFRAEPGCESYMLLEDRKRSGRFTTFEAWADEKALARHLNAPSTNALALQLENLLDGEVKQNFLSARASQ